MHEMFQLLFDYDVLRALFGWGSKRERALAINNLVAFSVVLYCLYYDYYMTAGLFFIYVVIMLILKINLMSKSRQKAADKKTGAL